MLVIYVCMHLSSKACTLLTTFASRPQSVRMVSSPCTHFIRRWTSEHHQWALLVGLVSVAQFYVCVIIQALVHGCATKLASTKEGICI